MAGGLFRVILHFRSNFEGTTDKVYVSKYVEDWIRSMQGIGQVTDIEVVCVDEVPDQVATVQDRLTVPAPAPPAMSVPPGSIPIPAVMVEEPETGKKTKIPGTGEPE
jgi:hypothetical protein